MLEAGEDELPPDPFARIASHLAALPEDGPRIPEAVVELEDPEAGRRLLERVSGESRRLVVRLQGLVESDRARGEARARRGRRIATARLARVAAGNGRVFRRRAERRAPETALHLLLDRSGSMRAPGGPGRRSRLELGLEAALALALALEGIPGASVAVSAFPARDGRSVLTLLGRGERVRDAAGRFWLKAAGGTPLAGALWHAAAELVLCPEPRKVVVVLTDGRPDGGPEVVAAILARCRESGIEPIGIGLRIDVGALFERAITIEDLGTLRRRLLDVARGALRA